VSEKETRFTELYRREYRAVYRFLASRTDQVGDLVAETFSSAWRKLDQLPVEPNEARAWLFATARYHLLHQQRSTARATALAVRLTEQHDDIVPGPEANVLRSLGLATAWQQLSAEQQELLALIGWEELTLAQAAKVLGVSVPTVRLRLRKARAALRELLAESVATAGDADHKAGFDHLPRSDNAATRPGVMQLNMPVQSSRNFVNHTVLIPQGA